MGNPAKLLENFGKMKELLRERDGRRTAELDDDKVLEEYLNFLDEAWELLGDQAEEEDDMDFHLAIMEFKRWVREKSSRGP